MNSLFYFFIFFAVFTIKNQLMSSSLDGTTSIIYKNEHHVFSDTEFAQGFVRMNNGFTIKPGATATLDTQISVSGGIDLRETGILQFVSDLKLDSSATWTNSGSIKGFGNAIILRGNLSLNASKMMHIIGDTVIDGQGNSLYFNEYAQLLIDNNATLTLRNMIISGKRYNSFNPCITVHGEKSKLALDNVVFNLKHNTAFSEGELYIHNDVIFTGTNQFIYTSPRPIQVASKSKLMFDLGTTFSFAPATSLENLFVLEDKTSVLHLNGCTLKTTSSGMRLSKGRLIVENKVIFETQSDIEFSSLTTLTSRDYSSNTSSIIYSINWHPDEKVLAIGGYLPESGFGGFLDTNEIRLYKFENSQLLPLTSQNFPSSSLAQVESVAWHPTGNFFAIGGRGGSGADIYLFKFDGSTLTTISTKDLGFSTIVNSVAWSPNGKYLATGTVFPGSTAEFPNTNELRIYSFNETTLTAVTSQDYNNLGGGYSLESVDWHPSGTILAIGGYGANAVGGFANTDQIRLYSFDGSTLTALTSIALGTAQVHSVAWSPDGRYLAVGGSTSGAPSFGQNVRVYAFDGATLTDMGGVQFNTGVDTVKWHPTGKYIAACGQGQTSSSPPDLRFYKFNEPGLSTLLLFDYGLEAFDVAWSKDGSILTVAGWRPENGVGGFTNTDELRLYTVNYTKKTTNQALSKSLIFGNSNLGSEYDLNVEILGNAHVIVDGNLVDDSA